MGVESEQEEEEEENEEFCPSLPNTSMMGRTLAIPIYKALLCFVIGYCLAYPRCWGDSDEGMQ